MREVLTYPLCVQAGFVHADQTDGGEVVVKTAEIALGIGIQTFVEKFRNNVSLDFKTARGNVHKFFQTGVKLFFAARKVSDTRHIDGDYADTSRGLAAAEETAALFAEFSQVETQSAAHTADVAGFHIAVDIVGKIRSAVLGGHFKQEFVVFRLRPVKVAGDGIRGYGVLKTSAVSVALYHNFDKGLVNHRHFLDAILVFKVLFYAADDSVQFRQIVRHHPVQRNIGKRRLRAPTAGSIYAVNERLNTLFYFFVRQVIDLYERREIGIEGRKSLSARPFVLHYAQKVNHLVAQSGQVACRRTRDFSGDTAETFLDKLF